MERKKMKDKCIRQNFARVIVASVSCFIFFVACGKSQERVSYTKVGDTVPSFSLATLEGTTFHTEAMKGKVVLLNFWATWCAPCLIEMPKLESEIWQKYKGLDFAMIAIAREQGYQEIKAFQEKHKFTFPMGPDPNRAIYSKFSNAGIPRNYLINRKGQIIYQSMGFTPKDFEELIALLDKELKSGSQ
jgi:peroxiredoxin